MKKIYDRHNLSQKMHTARDQTHAYTRTYRPPKHFQIGPDEPLQRTNLARMTIGIPVASNQETHNVFEEQCNGNAVQFIYFLNILLFIKRQLLSIDNHKA